MNYNFLCANYNPFYGGIIFYILRTREELEDSKKIHWSSLSDTHFLASK